MIGGSSEDWAEEGSGGLAEAGEASIGGRRMVVELARVEGGREGVMSQDEVGAEREEEKVKGEGEGE